MEEHLFRSVEGQAASDEEEDKWTGDQQRQVDEVKRILTRLSCCGERYCTPMPSLLTSLQCTVHNQRNIEASLLIQRRSYIFAISLKVLGENPDKC